MNEKRGHQVKKILFLQSPHGPFFDHLANILKDSGAKIDRIVFNGGDLLYWQHKNPVQFNQPAETYPAFIEAYLHENEITDIVLYGDMRPVHSAAIKAAHAKNITVHCFEEGYLRPYWVTYERDGTNGNSKLMHMDMPEIIKKRALRHVDLQPAPAQWGSLWHHIWYGFRYHLHLALHQKQFKNYTPHRGISVWKEVRLNASRLARLPYQNISRNIQTKRFLLGGRPFFMAVLQLEHDSSLVYHSDYKTQESFIREVIHAFAQNAASHFHLILKLHPMDDGRVSIRQWAKEIAAENHVSERIHIFPGGKLGKIITCAHAVLAINSTAIQQAMWRGIPVKLMGRSIFGKPEFTSQQSLEDFFKSPKKPNKEAFLAFRSYLLETSQIAGGYYTNIGRSEALRHVIHDLLQKEHSYDMHYETEAPLNNA